MIALAIFIDNLAEALSIGELIRDKQKDDKHRPVWRVLKWTGLIGVSLLASALAGWLLLRGLSQRRSWASCSRSAAAGCFISQSPISCPKRRSANISSQPRSRSAPAS